MKVIVITGMPGAGKEEFVSVALSIGYEVVRMGDVVREWASKQGLEPNDKAIGGFANDERKRLGYDIWAKRCVERVGSPLTIIDGSRGLDELRIFKNAFGEEVRLVAVHSSPRTRFQRLQRRGRADAPGSWEEFLERDLRELSWGLGGLIAVADRMIINEGTLDEFRTSALRYLQEQG